MKHANGMYLILGNTVVLLVVEIVAHYKSNATSVLGEAFHMLSDVVSVCLSIGAAFVLRRFKGSSQFTFGLERLEVVSSCLSLVLLWVPSFYLLYLSICRLAEPEEIDRAVLLAVSLLSLSINLVNLGISVYLNRRSNDMNISSLYMHALTDLIQSLSMCASGIALFINSEYVVVDLICTVAGTAVCLGSSLGLAKDVFRMLLDISPLDVKAVREALLGLPAVEAVDDLKIWGLNRRNTLVMAKLAVFPGEQHQEVVLHTKELLRKLFGVTYSNVEINS